MTKPVFPAELAGSALQRSRGDAGIAVKLAGGWTRLHRLHQEGCAKIKLPNTHDHSVQAVLINTSGGLTGGDHLTWQARADDGCYLVVTTQACERIYRSLGPAVRVATQLSAGAGARIDWLPQETIVFDNSVLQRSLDVELAEGAEFTAVEAVLLGRDAMGETARQARLSDTWRVRRNGRLIHAEQSRLTGRGAERDGSALLDGAGAYATILHIGADCERKGRLVHDLIASSDRAGVSVLGERLVVRVLAESGLALRRLIIPVIAELSSAGTLPRLWHS